MIKSLILAAIAAMNTSPEYVEHYVELEMPWSQTGDVRLIELPAADFLPSRVEIAPQVQLDSWFMLENLSEDYLPNGILGSDYAVHGIYTLRRQLVIMPSTGRAMCPTESMAPWSQDGVLDGQGPSGYGYDENFWEGPFTPAPHWWNVNHYNPQQSFEYWHNPGGVVRLYYAPRTYAIFGSNQPEFWHDGEQFARVTSIRIRYYL